MLAQPHISPIVCELTPQPVSSLTSVATPSMRMTWSASTSRLIS